MRHHWWRLNKAARNQKNNFLHLLSRQPVTTPSLGSMTLDWDDVNLAREWLRNKPDWNNPELVMQYETVFAKWNGSKHAFAFMGGRVALSACIYALDLKRGDEVILPGYTCVVVPNAFHYAGVKTVYGDIELDTYGLDASRIEDKITAKTRAILLQHLYGLVCRDYEAILTIAKRYGLKVIEDCAHATGAEFRNCKVGTQGDIAFYSSEQSKVFNTIQGGLAVTNDERLACQLSAYYEQAPYPHDEQIDKALHNVLINYYQAKDPQRWWRGDLVDLLWGDKRLNSTTVEEERGIRPTWYGCKMAAPIAALGLNQLKKIERYNQQRRDTARRWASWCHKNGYKKPVVVDESLPVYLRFPVLVEPEKKQNRSWARKELGVDVGVWFISKTHPVMRPVDDCPNADQAVAKCINFPSLL
jgi:perosamine synthetase